MPRNNRHIEQHEKKRDIINAASELFTANGFDATSMAAIAKQAGITPNTIYWYFANKDEVLIAVLNEVTAAGLIAAASSSMKSPKDRILEMISFIERPGSLMSTVHARIALSEAVSAWHDRFHAMIEQIIIVESLRLGIPRDKAESYARLLVYVIEGLISHPLQSGDRERVIGEMLTLVGIETAPPT